MKIEVSKIKTALANIKSIVGRRTALPILSCVKLHTEGGWLHITGSNLDEFIVEKVECDGEFKPACVSFNFLSLALSGESVEITSESGSLTIKCGSDKTKLSTLDATEFPPFPKLEKLKNHGCACDALSESIRSVAWAASTDLSRYVAQSVLIECESKKLLAVATNGRELAICETALIGSKFQIIAPSAFCGNLAESLLRKGSALSSSESYIFVSHDFGSYYCKQMGGNYPNYKQVIPKDFKRLGVVNVEAMKLMASQCVGYSAQGEARGVFKFSKAGLVVEFVGDNNATLSRNLAGEFEPFTVALSTRKMLLIFQNLKTETAEIRFVDELSPIAIVGGDLSVYSMPMRLA